MSRLWLLLILWIKLPITTFLNAPPPIPIFIREMMSLKRTAHLHLMGKVTIVTTIHLSPMATHLCLHLLFSSYEKQKSKHTLSYKLHIIANLFVSWLSDTNPFKVMELCVNSCPLDGAVSFKMLAILAASVWEWMASHAACLQKESDLLHSDGWAHKTTRAKINYRCFDQAFKMLLLLIKSLL